VIGVLARSPFYMAYRRTGWPRMLPASLTITPSPRCNSRCSTCNIWKKREDELRLDEWERVFHSLGRAPFWFTISGGEPFMVPDLVPLCQSLYERCRPAIINIPTNGIMDGAISTKVKEICRGCPDAQVIINLSLDGVGEKHDRIRGIPGNFARFERTYQALRALDCPNLAIGIHSVISKFNVADAPQLFEYALSLHPDAYITEIAEERVELGTVGLKITPSLGEYTWAIDQLLDRIGKRRFRGLAAITEAFRLRYYGLVKRTLAEQTQIIPCFAGWASTHIYANGDVWPCCVRADTMGNLRDVAYDFKRIWFSPKAERVRASIRHKQCHCPLANASYTNMLMHPATLASVGLKVAQSWIRNVASDRWQLGPERPNSEHIPSCGSDALRDVNVSRPGEKCEGWPANSQEYPASRRTV